MKKTRRITAAMLSLTMLATGASSLNANSVYDPTESAQFVENNDSFFVVVGTWNHEYTQLRYFYTTDSGRMNAKKVIINETSAEYKYGDILVCDDEPALTLVDPYISDPVYSHTWFYALSDDSGLTLLGSCADLMPRKELTVTSAEYDGSGHWSIRFTDDGEEKYYYGFSAVGSNLEYDLSKAKVGEVYTFAMYKDTPAAVCVVGDANLDVKVSVADSVAILQHIGNRDKYGLSSMGLLNADVDGEAGVTANDARVLQEWDANQ